MNSKSEIHVRFENFLFKVKRVQIEVQNLRENSKVYRLEVSESGCLEALEIMRRKEVETVRALKSFMKEFGGRSSLTVLRRKSENDVRAEDSISKIPGPFTFHTENFKKVYEVPSVEFYDIPSTVNYISNRSIENISPMISNSLDLLSAYLEGLEPLKALKVKCLSLGDVLENRKLVELLSEEERKDFSHWLFLKFGHPSVS